MKDQPRPSPYTMENKTSKRALPVVYGGKKQPYPKAIIVDKFVFCSGHQGFDPETGKLVVGGIKAETQVALNKVVSTLKEAGTSVQNVVRADFFLRRLEDWPVVLDVAKKFFDPTKIPGILCQAVLTQDSLIKVAPIAVLSKATLEVQEGVSAGGPDFHTRTAIAPPLVFCSSSRMFPISLGEKPEAAGIRFQTETILRRIESSLEGAGSSLTRLAKMDVYLKRREDWIGVLGILKTFYDTTRVAHAVTEAELPGSTFIQLVAVAILPGAEVDVVEGLSLRGTQEYAAATIAPPFVFCSGIQGRNLLMGEVVTGGIEAQTERALKNLQTILEKAGTSADNILSMSILLKELENIPQLFQVINCFYDSAKVAGILFKSDLPQGVAVEFQAIATLPDP